jgi:spermidine/putrescine transport system ATP-binding protein
MTAIHIQTRNLLKSFGSCCAVHDVSLEINKGEFFSLLGPSGCGKTTLLRMIAGLESPSEGSILMNDKDITSLPPYERKTNMVFQQYALFPHLTVEENILFGLRYKKNFSKTERKEKVRNILGLVQLTGFETRYSHELSGGQRQRVALARALILEPEALLLDEPLSALDQKLRTEMQVELKKLQRSLGITFILVTHDQEEALTMSDRIAVMNQGKIEQLDRPAVVFEKPRTEFVARFMNATNLFNAEIKTQDKDQISVETCGAAFILKSNSLEPQGNNIQLVVRPEKMKLVSTSTSELNLIFIPVIIKEFIYKGSYHLWVVQTTDGSLLTINQESKEDSNLNIGNKAFACWDPKHTVVLERT